MAYIKNLQTFHFFLIIKDFTHYCAKGGFHRSSPDMADKKAIKTMTAAASKAAGMAPLLPTRGVTSPALARRLLPPCLPAGSPPRCSSRVRRCWVCLRLEDEVSAGRGHARCGNGPGKRQRGCVRVGVGEGGRSGGGCRAAARGASRGRAAARRACSAAPPRRARATGCPSSCPPRLFRVAVMCGLE